MRGSSCSITRGVNAWRMSERRRVCCGGSEWIIAVPKWS